MNTLQLQNTRCSPGVQKIKDSFKYYRECLKSAILECAFFMFNPFCSLLVPDLRNDYCVYPDQTSHTAASDLGLIVVVFFFFVVVFLNSVTCKNNSRKISREKLVIHHLS